VDEFDFNLIGIIQTQGGQAGFLDVFICLAEEGYPVSYEKVMQPPDLGPALQRTFAADKQRKKEVE
jgi:hypothetical protein